MAPSVPKRIIETLFLLCRTTWRCLNVSTGKVVSPLRRGAILIDQFRARAVLGTWMQSPMLTVVMKATERTSLLVFAARVVVQELTVMWVPYLWSV